MTCKPSQRHRPTRGLPTRTSPQPRPKQRLALEWHRNKHHKMNTDSGGAGVKSCAPGANQIAAQSGIGETYSNNYEITLCVSNVGMRKRVYALAATSNWGRWTSQYVRLLQGGALVWQRGGHRRRSAVTKLTFCTAVATNSISWIVLQIAPSTAGCILLSSSAAI